MTLLTLVNTSYKDRGRLGNIRATAWPPLNLPYLAAVTPKHYKIEVLDENIEQVGVPKADIVGITANTASVSRAYQIALLCREKGIPTVMGGIHVSMMPEEAKKYCDSVVIGEAEEIWPKVLGDFEGNKLQPIYKGTWPELDSLPIPRRDILQIERYGWGSIQTSRGCPMNCTFCSVTAFNGQRFRRRPLEHVMDELKQIPQKRVLLADDNIIGYGSTDLEWTKMFFERIIREGIDRIFYAQTSIDFGDDREFLHLASRAGVKLVFIGIESVNPQTLQSYQKKLNLRKLLNNQITTRISRIRKAGIAVMGGFVLGADEDDRSIFYSTLQFIKAAHIDVVQITKPTPLPGTKMWDNISKGGRLINQDFPKAWDNFTLTRLVFEPAKISIDDVYRGVTYLCNTYFSPLESVKRTLSTFVSTRSIAATSLALGFNSGFRKNFQNSEHFRRYNKDGNHPKLTYQAKELQI